MVLTERAQVLITVKAMPEPSEKYGDTVCVAGIRIDTVPHRFIRLYPVPFRWLTAEQQFHKYDVIEVDLLPAKEDKRPESFRVRTDTIKRQGEPIKKLPARGAILDPLIGPTMCDLYGAVVKDMNAPSLGLVHAREVQKVIVEPGKPWTPTQQAKIDRALHDENLFGDAIPAELKAPRFTVKYKYLCDATECNSHTQSIIDWELGGLMQNLRRDSDDVASSNVQAKFLHDMCGQGRRPNFFVGNIANPLKRRSFSVLGVYSPPAASNFASTLDLGI